MTEVRPRAKCSILVTTALVLRLFLKLLDCVNMFIEFFLMSDLRHDITCYIYFQRLIACSTSKPWLHCIWLDVTILLKATEQFFCVMVLGLRFAFFLRWCCFGDPNDKYFFFFINVSTNKDTNVVKFLNDVRKITPCDSKLCSQTK